MKDLKALLNPKRLTILTTLKTTDGSLGCVPISAYGEVDMYCINSGINYATNADLLRKSAEIVHKISHDLASDLGHQQVLELVLCVRQIELIAENVEQMGTHRDTA